MASLAYHLTEVEIALDPEHPQHLLPDLSSCSKGIVDVGCGIGQLFVAKDDEIKPGVQRYGIDRDADSVAFAREAWPHLARFIQARAESLPLRSSSVDWYVSRVALPYTKLQLSIPEAARVLVPGGRLWITLHPARTVWHEFVSAVRRVRPRESVTRAIVLVNGASLQLIRRVPALFGIHESWQSWSAIKRLLKHARFEQIRGVKTANHFLVEAIRRR